MKKITREMLKIYKPLSGLDWMNYRITRNQLTFHHIIKKSDGGREVVENGAILMSNPHQYLHTIEFADYETYIALNKIFGYINEQKHEPTAEQRQIIEYLLRSFEEEHKEDVTSKGKMLIKPYYLQRW